mgnify:CR=1 FL=1
MKFSLPWRRLKNKQQAPTPLESRNNSLEEAGQLLREQRERRGLSMRDLSKEVRITTPVLEALERGWQDRLPEPAYLVAMLQRLETYFDLPNNSLLAALPNKPGSNRLATNGRGTRFTLGSIDIFTTWQGSVVYGAVILGSILALNHQQRHLINLNAFGIICFQVIISFLMRKTSPLTSIIVGVCVTIASFGLYLLGTSIARPLIAKRLIERFGSYAAAIAAPIDQLTEVKGIGPKTALDLKIIVAAATRLGQQTVMDKPVLSSWTALMDYCRSAMQFEAKEQFRVLFLDRKNCLIADEEQAKGTVDHVPVYPREIAKRALELNASALILVHNHPSGDPSPSASDLAMTDRILQALDALGITLHDHLIIGKSSELSFRSSGYL